MMMLKMPYMLGVYLGINAFPDVSMVVDGPDCMFFKAEYVHGSHDLRSTLLRVDGRHRVAHTLADTNNVVIDRETVLAELLGRIALSPDVSIVLVSAMPLASITGSQYDRIGIEVGRQVGKPIVEIPAGSLLGDWLDGYAEVLDGVVRALPLGPPALDKEKVAVVGLCVDRGEADQRGNLAEVRRLIEDGLGLHVAAFLPGLVPVRDLLSVSEAGTVLSLPYGRKAARRLAARTGARLLELPLPMGRKATTRFMQEIGEAFGLGGRARQFIAEEEQACSIHLERSRKVLTGRRAFVMAEPYLGPPLVDAIQDLGVEIGGYIKARDPFDGLPGVPGLEALDSGIDLLVGQSRVVDVALQRGYAFVEVGFPSYGHHALVEEPILGFRGIGVMADRIRCELDMIENLWTFGGIDLRAMWKARHPGLSPRENIDRHDSAPEMVVGLEPGSPSD